MTLLDSNVQLPMLPAHSARLLEMMHQPVDRIDVRRVVGLVEQDQALAARLLRLANSPAYGAARNINRLHQAIVAIGLTETVEAVNYLVMRKALPRAPSLPFFNPEDFWMHSWACASIARLLGDPQFLVGDLPGELYLAGLLHDIGKLMLAVYLPVEFGRCLQFANEQKEALHRVEHAALGVDHAVLGAHLLDTWNLPVKVLEAVGFHHDPASAPDVSRQLAGLIELADALTLSLDLTHSGNPAGPSLPACWTMRMGRTSLDAGVLRERVLREFSVLRKKQNGLEVDPAPEAAAARPPESVSLADGSSIPIATARRRAAPRTLWSRLCGLFHGRGRLRRA